VTSHDSGDDGEEDPQLKSLRAVWLSLPDEEPPERGLAELMAAARVKAEQMAKPSLWQRISALLRRPPVLALATVLVLIGGAVFIGQRHSKLEAQQEAPAERVRETGATGAGSAAAPANTVAPPEGAPAGGQPAPADEVPPPAATTAEPMPEPKKDVAQKVETPRRPTHRAPASSAATATTPSKTLDFSAPDRAPLKATDDKESKNAETRGFDGASELVEGDLGEKQSNDRFASPPPPAEAPAADVRVGGGATKGAATTQPEVSRAARYVAQAKSAAARGDCGAARMLMKRVASEDAASYRKALASDAALKKCFE